MSPCCFVPKRPQHCLRTHRTGAGTYRSVIRPQPAHPRPSCLIRDPTYDDPAVVCTEPNQQQDAVLLQLGLSVTSQKLSVRGTRGVVNNYSSSIIDLHLRTDAGEIVPVQGSIMPCVADPVPVIDWARLQERWDHLRGLLLRCSGEQVDVLLGLDYVHLSASMETRCGEDFEPVAAKTRLGWLVGGVVGADAKPKTARVHHIHAETAEFDSAGVLASAVKRLFDTEAFGSEYTSDCLSPDNRRATEMLRDGIKRLDIGYQAPILWREGEPNLADNFPLAESRIGVLKRRFARDPDFEKKYRGHGGQF